MSWTLFIAPGVGGQLETVEMETGNGKGQILMRM